MAFAETAGAAYGLPVVAAGAAVTVDVLVRVEPWVWGSWVGTVLIGLALVFAPLKGLF